MNGLFLLHELYILGIWMAYEWCMIFGVIVTVEVSDTAPWSRSARRVNTRAKASLDTSGWMLVAVSSFIQRFYPLMVRGMLVKFHFSAAELSKGVLTSFGYETSLSFLSNGHCLNLPMAETWIRQRGKQCWEAAAVMLAFLAQHVWQVHDWYMSYDRNMIGIWPSICHIPVMTGIWLVYEHLFVIYLSYDRYMIGIWPSTCHISVIWQVYDW